MSAQESFNHNTTGNSASRDVASLSTGTSSPHGHKAHHLEEFGDVDKLVHIEHHETTDQHDDVPAPPISRNDKLAWKGRTLRLKRRLFAKRHLMQYFHDEVLYRTEGNRKVGADELFLDLVIVGSIAALGHELRETFKGWEDIEKFFLLFTAMYSSWRTVVLLWNLFDLRSDLTDKFGIYTVFFSLTGIALGAHGAFDNGIRPYVAVCSFTATAIPAVTILVWSAKEPLLRNPANLVNQLVLTSAVSLLSVIPYLAAAFVDSERTSRILFWIPYAFQTVSIFFTGPFYRWLHRNRAGHTRLAIAIELFVEKYEILTMIVLGESVLSILFEAALHITKEGANVGNLYAAAAGGTAILYSLQTFYVNIDGLIGKGGVHAIRFRGLNGIIWGQIHTLYHLALILFATGLSFALRDIAITPRAESATRAADIDSVVGTRFGQSERWVFSTGWGAALILSAVISALHYGGPRAATKVYRLVSRCLVTVAIMVGMPFANISAGGFLGVFTGVIVVLAIVEFICVQMDRMGYFRSEETVLSISTDFVGNSRDSFGEGEDEDEHDIDYEDESDPICDLGEEAAAKVRLDRALQTRLRRRHCNRLVLVDSTARNENVAPSLEVNDSGKV